jgi:hypothetical protein
MDITFIPFVIAALVHLTYYLNRPSQQPIAVANRPPPSHQCSIMYHGLVLKCLTDFSSFIPSLPDSLRSTVGHQQILKVVCGFAVKSPENWV